jgi:hypothetical protein
LIVERTNKLQPELIVILGDYLSGEGWMSHRVEPEVFAAVLKDFRAPLGVYSVFTLSIMKNGSMCGLKPAFALVSVASKVRGSGQLTALAGGW